jgi:hypothetical protein
MLPPPKPSAIRLATPNKEALKRKKTPNKPHVESIKKKWKRQPCENCGDLFDKKRRNQRFCPKNNGQCRKEFFRYGAAFGPLKIGLHKAIDKKYADLEYTMRNQHRTLALAISVLTNDVMELRDKLKPLLVEREKAARSRYID